MSQFTNAVRKLKDMGASVEGVTDARDALERIDMLKHIERFYRMRHVRLQGTVLEVQ